MRRPPLASYPFHFSKQFERVAASWRASELAKENRTRIVDGGGQKQGQLAGFGERSAAAAATIAGAAESRIKLSAPSELAAAFVGAFA